MTVNLLLMIILYSYLSHVQPSLTFENAHYIIITLKLSLAPGDVMHFFKHIALKSIEAHSVEMNPLI